jgi:hypothetical protein
MNFRKIAVTLSFSLLMIAPELLAQERLVSVSGNPVLARKCQVDTRKSGMQDTLALPILDDFSTSKIYPGSNVWIDSKVYINPDFGYNPPSFQVATLDMIDSTGKIYEHATVESFLADELTSLPVDLFYPGDTTVYLSFFYQPQGLGDAPEPTDSLIVELYAPDSHRWYRVWSVPGSPVQDFRIAMINITDSRFLQKGSRFRFRNYASLAPSYEPSRKVNADHWNIDYVYLNRNRHFNDTIMPDASLYKPVGSLLVNYTAMPWEHFNAAGISAVKTFFQVNMNNLSLDRRPYTPLFRITPVEPAGTAFEKTLISDEIKSRERISYDETFNYGFTLDAKDSAKFEISLDINQQTPDWIPGNDKITSQQIFTDYYSYDDGSAEAGYGLSGEGTKNAKLAVRYKNYYPADSLVAVDIYFNQSYNDASRKYFILAIWADDNNQPGELIHKQTGLRPEYVGINEFQTVILDTAQVVPSTYYVGWIQTTSDFLNIGFDRQNNHREDNLLNIYGTWQTSQFEGSLMIRPVFANKSRKTGMEENLASPAWVEKAKVFPNPASETVSITYTENPVSTRVILMDLQGRVILDTRTSGAITQLPVSGVRNGFYMIEIRSGSNILSRHKLMILHE